MPTAIEFPASLLREQAVRWSRVGITASPGLTTGGAFPLLALDGGGLWTCELSNISVNTKAHVLSWRAMEALADGGATPIIVPMCDKRHGPFPLVGDAYLYSYGDAGIPHSDDSYFSDDVGYDQNVVLAQVVTAASLRAVQLTISFAYGGPLQGGEFFSIEHASEGWRLYEIATVGIDDDGDSVITFRPPLRAAVGAGTQLEFDHPRCVMRLAVSGAMNLTLSQRKYGQPSLAFIETFLT